MVDQGSQLEKSKISIKAKRNQYLSRKISIIRNPYRSEMLRFFFLIYLGQTRHPCGALTVVGAFINLQHKEI